MRSTSICMLLVVASVSLSAWGASKKEAVKVGEAIPALKALNEAGEEVDLSTYKGKSGLVIFFFPKADTPGCTIETCAFRDEIKAFEEKGFVVFGASVDKPDALLKFKTKFEVSYHFLSDPKAEIAGTFGFKARERKTAVIGKDGTLRKVYDTVSVKTHAKDILKELE